MLQVGFLT